MATETIGPVPPGSLFIKTIRRCMTYNEIIKRLISIQQDIENNESVTMVSDELGVLIRDIENGSDILDDMEFA